MDFKKIIFLKIVFTILKKKKKKKEKKFCHKFSVQKK